MNFPTIKEIIEHLQKVCPCLSCKKHYQIEDINVLASTNVEGLFEMQCGNCNHGSLVTVMLKPEIEIIKQNLKRGNKLITKDDILDIKNFLHGFNGDFKKIFSKSK